MKHISLIVALAFTTITTLSAVPKVSIITSVFKGDKFIKGFFEDITAITIFDQCELIIINANSPGNEDAIIQTYTKCYPNIRYIKLDYDPGIYGVWNMAIQLAQADFITNANLDDRHNPTFLAYQVKELEKDTTIDLVYADFFISFLPNISWSTFRTFKKTYQLAYKSSFSPSALCFDCLPGPHPVWRKSMHNNYGYFDERFFSAGDWEMWLRAASKGAKFKKIKGTSGIFYFNPQGLSTASQEMSHKTSQQREQEALLVDQMLTTYKPLLQKITTAVSCKKRP
jgi:glycosyltransferase involved in cell wall biosynthesis